VSPLVDRHSACTLSPAFEADYRMKLVIDMTGFWPGGAERQVLDLGNGLVARGHDVLLILHQRAWAYQRELWQSDMDAVELQRTSGFDARTTWWVYRALRARGAQVCLSELVSPWGRLAAVLAGCPLVVAEHSSDRPLRRRVLWTNRVFRPATAQVVACAQAQIPTLVREGHAPDKIAVIRNGVDTRAFRFDAGAGRAFRERHGLPTGDFVLGLVAAQRTEKRHDRFIDLVGLLRRAGVPAWGCAIGAGPLLSENRRLASQSEAHRWLRFPGGVQDMIAAYSACDVVVLVSDAVETFPLAFLEAQACEVPVVAMDIGGVRETVTPGLTGEIVRQGDMEGMTASLVRLARNPQERLAMGKAARHWVTTSHEVERMVDAYESLLMSLTT